MKYGFHIKLSHRPDIMARLARGDINIPKFEGFPNHVQISKINFEAAIYELLLTESSILASRLFYHCIPV